MKTSTNKIFEYLKSREVNYGKFEVETLLEFLWSAYSYVNPIDNDYMREKMEKMEPVLKPLSFEDANLIDDTIAALCFEIERLAFVEGVRVGARLAMELNEK